MPPCCYVYKLSIRHDKEGEFANFARNLSQYNEGLPDGAHFGPAFKTVVGLTWEPKHEIWFEFGSFSQMDEAMKAKGLQLFHRDLLLYLDPGRPNYNFILERLSEQPSH